jgi:hypothetical protein
MFLKNRGLSAAFAQWFNAHELADEHSTGCGGGEDGEGQFGE